MIDEPMSYEIGLDAIDVPLLIHQLTLAEVKQMPFDGDEPATNLEEAQERVIWSLNKCVSNIEEVKDAINDATESPEESASIILSVFACCLALNPVLDATFWSLMTKQKGLYHDYFKTKPLISAMPVVSKIDDTSFLDFDGYSSEDLSFLSSNGLSPAFLMAMDDGGEEVKGKANPKIEKEKILSLSDHMNKSLIGQPEAINIVSKTLKRAYVGLKDERRPLGIFLFIGSSGSGKTESARLIQEHLFGKDTRIVRVDCAEYQQKHEMIKLIGSPNSFVGSEDGGQLTNAVKEAENTVLLLDEAEKAHPDFWNMFLKVFEEGYLTDGKGDDISFENTIIIMTSNLGNDKLATDTYSRSAGFTGNVDNSYNSNLKPKRESVVRVTEEAVRKFFKPEFVNRLDEIVVFNYLSDEDLEKIAILELTKVKSKLDKKKIIFKWTKQSAKVLSEKSRVSIEGARAMARIRRREIEDPITELILQENVGNGSIIKLGLKNPKSDNPEFIFSTEKQKVPQLKIQI
jgi:MoxR-like ATPase